MPTRVHAKNGSTSAFDAPEGPVWLAGHPALLQEMVGNLVDNAVRYTSPDGRIVVRVFAGDAPVLEVEDDGGGIPAAERELVFERFYRVVGNNSSRLRYRPPAIVREIAIRHGAGVSVVAPENGVWQLVPGGVSAGRRGSPCIRKVRALT